LDSYPLLAASEVDASRWGGPGAPASNQRFCGPASALSAGYPLLNDYEIVGGTTFSIRPHSLEIKVTYYPWGDTGPEVFPSKQDALDAANLAGARVPLFGEVNPDGTLRIAGKKASFQPRLSGPGVVQRTARHALAIGRVGVEANVFAVEGHPSRLKDAVVRDPSVGSDWDPETSELLGWVPSVRLGRLHGMAVCGGIGEPVSGKSWSYVVSSVAKWCTLLRDFAKGTFGDERYRKVADATLQRLVEGFEAAQRSDLRVLKQLEKEGRSQRRDIEFLVKNQHITE
jgi:hypothetical protein